MTDPRELYAAALARTEAANPTLDPRQAEARDLVQLKLLSIFHYTLGAMALGTGVIMLLVLVPFVVAGGFMRGSVQDSGLDQDAVQTVTAVGTAFLVFSIIAGAWTLLLLAGGIASLVAGRRLRNIRSYTFLLAWGLWQWVLLFPFGIMLGMSTRSVLQRESVKVRFAMREEP